MTRLFILPRGQDFSERKFHQSLLRGRLFDQDLVLAHLMYISGNGNYSQLTMITGQTHLCSRNVSFYEKHLSECCDSFLRVHKQCLINIHFVKQYFHDHLIMSDGLIVPIARRRKGTVYSKMRVLSLKKSELSNNIQ